MRWLALIAMAGCSAVPVSLAPPPDVLTAPCAAPVAVPVRDASRAEVARWWIADRAALVDCGRRQRALAEWAAAAASAS